MPLSSLLAPELRSPLRKSLRRGSYLSDGVRLFRVVSPPTTVRERTFVRLEDCRTLEVQAYPPSELDSMGLRAVQPAG